MGSTYGVPGFWVHPVISWVGSNNACLTVGCINPSCARAVSNVGSGSSRTSQQGDLPRPRGSPDLVALAMIYP